ncbi:MAG: segregation/condensation protein A [Phycisphaerae bacterium]
MPDYRVDLDIYNGPLDLLLYLIRRDEVDIYDIPIARITQQYVGYVELLERLDPNLAGAFLVMAATLMEIKTRMLLPTPSPEEGGEDGLEIDPRAELVRQLLEYKAFKDAAGDLREAATARAMKFHRPLDKPDEQEPELDLEDAQVWDLLDAFSRLMAAIGAEAPTHEVIYDDTPIELHEADILDRLRRDGPMSFERIFEGRTDRMEVLGLFLALLELIRLHRILAAQRKNFGEIHIRLNPEAPQEAPQGEAFSGRRHGGPASEPASAPASGPPVELGEYVSDAPRPQGDEDDPRRETSEAGS